MDEEAILSKRGSYLNAGGEEREEKTPHPKLRE